MVISISYAWPELKQCKLDHTCKSLGYNSTQYVERANTGFQKLGVMGSSVIAADGDYGASNQDDACKFTAMFPASSPYVTSVGATRFITDQKGKIVNEIAISFGRPINWSTGGGFSSFQKAPSYQATAVKNWYELAKENGTLPPSNQFSTRFRGYPDVSFNGINYRIFISNVHSDKCPCSATYGDGTSASTPAFAGLVTLLNDALLNNSKKQLGFLNPLLYKMAALDPSTFRDIIEGNNGLGCKNRYMAQKGNEC
eukprot:TRINITY_DN9501_c0_g1_i1.p1 TRINITY_DN9501_c0_g1~~TRINITY_DN9501_c0_g1_i1.p1  ORF type:complete len:255 (-),score=36.23 TRINITY_DN9501_c0_g1_i1:211-975(-)